MFLYAKSFYNASSRRAVAKGFAVRIIIYLQCSPLLWSGSCQLPVQWAQVILFSIQSFRVACVINLCKLNIELRNKIALFIWTNFVNFEFATSKTWWHFVDRNPQLKSTESIVQWSHDICGSDVWTVRQQWRHMRPGCRLPCVSDAFGTAILLICRWSLK